ncbi:MAG TPA: protein kinase [Gemmataceae bacterium]|jgi:hypothetical protein
MPTTAAGHPPASVLAAFALGKLDAAAAETVHRHLAGCPDCRTVVETTPADSLQALVRDAAAGATPPPSQAGSATRGTLPLPNSDFDETELPAELRDHPRYRLLRKLGQGGMGAVYQAEHRMMERTVAVKVIAPGLVDSPEAAERFQREVKAAAKLEHANIVRAYDADRAGSAMLLAMEFVPGRTLADVVAAKGPLPVAYACRCIRQAAQGLQHAHEHGMVHRDIKPHNLMLTDKGVVKVLDFGLAKLASERTTRAGLTGAGMVMGTPEYIAPEQARNTAAADIRADIYALGCTLFCLLTGRPPFASGTAIEVMTKHIMDAPPRVTDLRPEAPAGLADLVARMLAKDPADRPQTPKDVADALTPFAKTAVGAASRTAPESPARLAGPTTTPPPLPRSRGTRRWWLAAAVAAAAIASVAAFVLLRTPDGVVEPDVPGNAEARPDGEADGAEPVAAEKADANPTPGRLDPRGKWKKWMAGMTARCAIWTDRDGWHVRCTSARTSTLRHVYAGTITVEGGTVEELTPILPKGYAAGSVVVSEDKKHITIDFATKGPGREAGFDFKVSRGSRQLDFDLNKRKPDAIHVGFEGSQPPSAIFALPVFDQP